MKAKTMTTFRSERRKHRNEHWETFKQGVYYADYDDIILHNGVTVTDAKIFLIHYNARFPIPENVTYGHIIATVADVYGIDRAELFRRTRKRPIPEARYVAMWLMHRHLGWTLHKIGKQFGMDHTSVLAATTNRVDYNGSIPNRLQYDGDLRAKVNEIERRVG